MQDLQDIYRLLAFVTVVQEGSLSSAVNKLHITQPALSARLKLLEEGLGCTLLDRTPRGVKPTSLGKLVYDISIDILKRMENLNTTMRNYVELREGFIHLGGTSTSVVGIIPDSISEFRKKHPKIQFTLLEKNTTSIVEALHDGAIDLGIIANAPSMRTEEDHLLGLKVHLEIPDSYEIIASPEHPLAKMAQTLAKENKYLLPLHLNKQPMIVLEPGITFGEIIENELKKLGINYLPIMRLRSTQSMIKMVKKNIGLAVVSMQTLKDEDEVQILKVQNLKITRSLLVCSVEDRALPPAVLKFIETLKTIY